jgi:hypothetical protein
MSGGHGLARRVPTSAGMLFYRDRVDSATSGSTSVGSREKYISSSFVSRSGVNSTAREAFNARRPPLLEPFGETSEIPPLLIRQLGTGMVHRPSTSTCCFVSSLKTFTSAGDHVPVPPSTTWRLTSGRFSGVHDWPVLGVPRG